MWRIATALIGAMAVSGCAQMGQDFSLRGQSPDNLHPEITNARVTRSTDEMESALGALYTRASLFEEPKRGSADWDRVILAGMDFVDESCGEYLTAVYIAERDAARTPSFGASIASVFGGGGVTKATFSSPEAAEKAADQADKASSAAAEDQKRPLSLQAAFFHAANEDSRAAYRRKLFAPAKAAKRREKFAALAALRGYVALCAPARVEAQLVKAGLDAR